MLTIWLHTYMNLGNKTQLQVKIHYDHRPQTLKSINKIHLLIILAWFILHKMTEKKTGRKILGKFSWTVWSFQLAVDTSEYIQDIKVIDKEFLDKKNQVLKKKIRKKVLLSIVKFEEDLKQLELSTKVALTLNVTCQRKKVGKRGRKRTKLDVEFANDLAFLLVAGCPICRRSREVRVWFWLSRSFDRACKVSISSCKLWKRQENEIKSMDLDWKGEKYFDKHKKFVLVPLLQRLTQT